MVESPQDGTGTEIIVRMTIDHAGNLYIVGTRPITRAGCQEQSVVVELDWPTQSGFQIAMRDAGYELSWPRSSRVASMRSSDSDVVYQLDPLNPVFRRIVDMNNELVLFARRIAPTTAPAIAIPQRFRDDFPVAPAFLEDLMSTSFQGLHLILPKDVQTPQAVNELVGLLYDHPEDVFYAFRPHRASFPEAFESAVADHRIRYVKSEFHFYRPLDPMGDDDFFQVQPGAPDAHQGLVDKSSRFERHQLALTEKHRRTLEIQQHLNEQAKKDSNPLKLEPGAFGISISLPKLWKMLSEWAKHEPKK